MVIVYNYVVYDRGVLFNSVKRLAPKMADFDEKKGFPIICVIFV